jgi:hypothetical protein
MAWVSSVFEGCHQSLLARALNRVAGAFRSHAAGAALLGVGHLRRHGPVGQAASGPG